MAMELKGFIFDGKRFCNTQSLLVFSIGGDRIVELYDYQIDAVKKMKNGCILCGGVGSGKSRTSIAYYFKTQGGIFGPPFRPMQNPCDLYIITTAHKRDTLEWEGELVPFYLYPDKSKALKLDISDNPALKPVYSNHVHVDSWNNIGKYTNVKNAFFIFDEQRVVGYGAWTKSFLKITANNQWILLSATPGDTWSDYMPVFIANGFYKNKTQFINDHVVYDYRVKFPKIKQYINTGRLIRLRNNILVDMDFNRKTNAHHMDIFCGYNATNYKNITKIRVNPETGLPIENASELCYQMRKIVNSDESRQLALLELIEDHPRSIIFYNFDYELEILKEILANCGHEVAEWNGHAHQPVPTCEKWVYLVQYTAGCEGWNCITTDTIIFYSQNYSYKVMQQASGRIDRLNTPFLDLYYYHLKTRSSIDVAISKALTNKKNFNESRFVNR